MNAVAHVIFNRGGAPGLARTLHEVIYGKNQFSSMSICIDPEYNLGAPSVTDREYASYVAATNIVKAVAERTDSDPTNGAMYCANLKESTSGWFVRHIVNDPVSHPKRECSPGSYHRASSGPDSLLRVRSRSNMRRYKQPKISEAASGIPRAVIVTGVLGILVTR